MWDREQRSYCHMSAMHLNFTNDLCIFSLGHREGEFSGHDEGGHSLAVITSFCPPSCCVLSSRYYLICFNSFVQFICVHNWRVTVV